MVAFYLAATEGAGRMGTVFGNTKPLLTAEELSAETGLSQPIIYRWTSEGRFPTEFIFKVGRRIYYRRAVIDWLAGLDATQPPETKAP